jgi:GT2 family glycosyltransferase
MAEGRRVAVAIPTLNSGEILSSCLKALDAQEFRDFEVIVVNNGPAGAVLPEQTCSFPCRVISPGSNVGFGAAINAAVRATSGPYVATLNDDTEPGPAWLSSLVREMDADSRVGMCASRILMHEDGTIDSAGMLICFDGSSKQRGHSLPAERFNLSEEVLLPSACAALYRRSMLDDVGLFDEDYFLYCEDTDLGLRARRAGWKCSYASGAVVAHRYSFTAGPFSVVKAQFVERNRLWVALKNFPLAILAVVPAVSSARYLWQLFSIGGEKGATARFFGSGNTLFSAGAIVLRAHWETLFNMLPLLRKRSLMRRTRRLGALEFARLLYRHRISAREMARA